MYQNLKLWKKLTKADEVRNRIKDKHQAESLRIYLNNENDDISVKLLQKEVSKLLIEDLNEEFFAVFQNRYKVTSTPILSGSYMDNPMQKKSVLYYFEKV